jgi:hypothetical protein
MRIKKYIVKYGFICNGGNMVAQAQAQEMKESDLSLALAMLDPFNHSKWMNQIKSLIRKGDNLVISMESQSVDHGTIGRVFKIVKN